MYGHDTSANNGLVRRILIVDDDAATRRLYRFLFTSGGYAVDEAEDGLMALEKLALQPTPVVITDMNMPRMNGVQLVAQIRQLYPTTYTIMVTAFGTSDAEKGALRAGADEYLAKPFDFDDLESRVQAFFAAQQRTPQIPR